MFLNYTLGMPFLQTLCNLKEIKKAKRVGVDYAGERWKNRLLRFYTEKF